LDESNQSPKQPIDYASKEVARYVDGAPSSPFSIAALCLAVFACPCLTQFGGELIGRASGSPSLVYSMLSVSVCLAVLSLVCALKAWLDIARSNGALNGKGNIWFTLTILAVWIAITLGMYYFL
jgi:hypothetical protein